MLAEQPYAEGVGDLTSLTLPSSDLQLAERVRARSRKLVVILLSGRPRLVTAALPAWDAFIAAWLPGTEGGGVADVLFGDAPFTGKLPYTWPRADAQLPFDFANLPTQGCAAPFIPIRLRPQCQRHFTGAVGLPGVVELGSRLGAGR